jgi:hypothetical protein
MPWGSVCSFALPVLRLRAVDAVRLLSDGRTVRLLQAATALKRQLPAAPQEKIIYRLVAFWTARHITRTQKRR